MLNYHKAVLHPQQTSITLRYNQPAPWALVGTLGHCWSAPPVQYTLHLQIQEDFRGLENGNNSYDMLQFIWDILGEHHTHTHPHAHAHTHTPTPTRTHTHKHTHTSTRTHTRPPAPAPPPARPPARTQAHTYTVHTHIVLYVCTYVRVHTYVRMYVCNVLYCIVLYCIVL